MSWKQAGLGCLEARRGVFILIEKRRFVIRNIICGNQGEKVGEYQIKFKGNLLELKEFICRSNIRDLLVDRTYTEDL